MKCSSFLKFAVAAIASGISWFSLAAGHSASEYQREGLLAQWDGIENVALGGATDTSSTTWADISGNGYDMTLTVAGSFNGKALVCAAKSPWYAAQNAGKKKITTARTVEVVFLIDTFKNEPFVFYLSNTQAIEYYNGNQQTSFRNTGTGYDGCKYVYDADKPINQVVLSEDGKTVSNLYRQGIEEEFIKGQHGAGLSHTCLTMGGRMGDNNTLIGRIFAVRVYSQRLSAEQLRIHALLDRIRFFDDAEAEAELQAMRARIAISGRPAPYGQPTPGYGYVNGLVGGESYSFTCPEAWTNAAEDIAAACTGWSLVKTNGEESAGADLSKTVVYDDSYAGAELTWNWAARNKLSVFARDGETVTPVESVWSDTNGCLAVTAPEAPTGRVFHHWEGGAVSLRGKFGSVLALQLDAPTSVTAVYAQALYVRKGGDDANSGSQADPVASLPRALELAEGVESAFIDVGEGTFVISNELTLASAIVLRGAGAGKTTLTRDAAAGKFRLVRLCHPDAQLSSVTVEKGELDGSNVHGANVRIDEAGGVVSDCVLRNGTGGQQRYGSVSAIGEIALVQRCVITNNVGRMASSYSGGGAAHLYGGSTIENCLVAYNSSGRGAVWIEAGSRVINCTIVGNSAIGAASSAGVHLHDAKSFVYNTVIAGNRGDTDLYCVYNDAVRGSQLFNCTTDKVDLEGLNGNVCGTPDFKDPANDDYTTSKDSCNVGAGSNDVSAFPPAETDLAGNPRLAEDGSIDAGCYQWTMKEGELEVAFQPSALTGILPLAVTFTPNVVGATGDYTCWWDLDGDGVYEIESQNDATVSKTYADAATYDVALKVVYRGEEHPAPSTKAIRAYPGEITVSDTMSIEDAVAAAGAGTVITIPARPDAYVLKNTVTIADQIAIKGETGNPRDVIITRNEKSQAFRLDNKGAWLSGVTVERTAAGAISESSGVLRFDANGGTISNCVIRNCTVAGRGGSIVTLESADALLTHCVLTNNTTSMDSDYSCGPVVLLKSGALEHSLVAANKITMTVSTGKGYAGVYVTGGTVRHCTVVDNCGFKNAGVMCSGTGSQAYDTVIAGNVVVEGYNPVRGTGAAENYHTCFADTEKINDTCLMGDPMFRNPARQNYRPRAKSPLVDAASGAYALPAVDLGGKPRVFGQGPDIGCYENQSAGLSLLVR